MASSLVPCNTFVAHSSLNPVARSTTPVVVAKATPFRYNVSGTVVCKRKNGHYRYGADLSFCDSVGKSYTKSCVQEGDAKNNQVADLQAILTVVASARASCDITLKNANSFTKTTWEARKRFAKGEIPAFATHDGKGRKFSNSEMFDALYNLCVSKNVTLNLV